MSTDTDNPIDDNAAAAESPVDAGDVQGDAQIESPEFQEFADSASDGQPGDLTRIKNIHITVSAELGKAEIPIQQLMGLAEGSVIELDRDIDSPVELFAQGVALASGEVLVVDGHFAIRILQVYDNQ